MDNESTDLYDMIKEFHAKFDLQPHSYPSTLNSDLFDFRYDFMNEELGEYRFAHLHKDKEKQLDALVDLVYVALGTAYLQGFDFNEAFRRVHNANMNKVRAFSKDQSARNSTYDVVKPPGWKAADLSDLVK